MPRKPGRPAQEQAGDAGNAIVKAACLFFARHGIRATSNRQIAAEAKVTPAMVHYYFREKASLHAAVLESTFEPLLQQLRGIASLEDWVLAFHAHLSAYPWLPHLMMREVLTPTGELRPLFLKHYAPQIFGSVKALMTLELQEGDVHGDLDVDRHIVLLLGMLVYPFLGLDVAPAIIGRRFDRKMMTGFRDDALKLFMSGIRHQGGK